MAKYISRPMLISPPVIFQRASPNGVNVLSFGSSIKMFRSARYRILGRRCSRARFQRAFHNFQQIWNATIVLPVPVAIVSRTRRHESPKVFAGRGDLDVCSGHGALHRRRPNLK